MKSVSFIILFVLIAYNCFAQDTIIKHSNELIIAKVLEITPTEIKFKKFNFQDGPTYIENKSEIKFIRYANGVKEEFQEQKKKTKQIS